MTRHGKNQTASGVYSYYERKKDEKQSGWGSLKERLGKDSIKEFDVCCLSLQPCRNPITPDGYLYDKEAILEYILKSKRENAKKLKDWDKQRQKDSDELAELARIESDSKLKKFAKQEMTPAHPGTSVNEEEQILAVADQSSTSVARKSVSNMDGTKAKQLPSFWIPSLVPSAAADKKTPKPDQKVYCPMSKKPLKLKDLMPVTFTPSNPDETPDTSRNTEKERYMCAISHDILTNVTQCAVLKTSLAPSFVSGNVVTLDAVNQVVKKDMTDPTNGKKLTDKDIIPLQRGGTGFSQTNDNLDAKKQRAVMELI